MLHREKFEVEFSDLYREYKYGTTIWSPLAGGMVSLDYFVSNSCNSVTDSPLCAYYSSLESTMMA